MILNNPVWILDKTDISIAIPPHPLTVPAQAIARKQLADRPIQAEVANRLRQALPTASAKAWNCTERLLSEVIVRQQINIHLIVPWQITKESDEVYAKILNGYANQLLPQRLSMQLSSRIRQLRQHYTSVDPRVLSFIAMQIHYCGQLLLELAPVQERSRLCRYIQIVEDQLYLPFQRVYQAAAKHEPDSPIFQVIQRLLPLRSQIAKRVTRQVALLYSSHLSQTGQLTEPTVHVSSLRDAEAFQMYLWICALEGNISAIEVELLPLCAALYPRLNVQWDLVWHLIYLLGHELRTTLEPTHFALLAPYHQALWSIFSPDAVTRQLSPTVRD